MEEWAIDGALLIELCTGEDAMQSLESMGIDILLTRKKLVAEVRKLMNTQSKDDSAQSQTGQSAVASPAQGVKPSDGATVLPWWRCHARGAPSQASGNPPGYALIYLGTTMWSFHINSGKSPDLADRWLPAASFRSHDFRKTARKTSGRDGPHL